MQCTDDTADSALIALKQTAVDSQITQGPHLQLMVRTHDAVAGAMLKHELIRYRLLSVQLHEEAINPSTSG